MVRLLFAIVTLALLALLPARAQGIRTNEEWAITTADTTLILAHDYIVPGSLSIRLDTLYTLRTPLDYTFDSRFGSIRLTGAFLSRLDDTTRRHVLSVEYRYRPIDLPREVFRRRLVTIVDSAGEERSVAEERGTLSSASIFGNDFRKSGSIVRGFTIGSNRDLSLQSRLWIQFSGKITDDVEVLGAVTDEQTPIQPEGNTQTLREVDNIFIEFRSPYVGGTVGKFQAANANSQWTAFSRKLQGVTAIGRYGRYGSTEVVAAASPGKFHTMLIQGRERDQGPYRLTGPSGERSILVIAGTEQVYVDGVQMVRGESNDYVIDYSTGEIFFQTRRVITSASRITIDFEYSDRQYSRSFVAVANRGLLFDSAVSLTLNYVREADNPDATIDITLDDRDRALLAAAAGDRMKAVRSGVNLVGQGDSLRGTYIRRDTVIDGIPDSVFIYAPGDPQALYNVRFSVAPDGRGDYRNVAFGRYEFAGRGLGSYLPVVYLPLPQLTQVVSIGAGIRPVRGVDISADMAYSDASVNRFSLDPSALRRGFALSAAASARADSLNIAGTALGPVAFTGTVRYLDSRFQTVERLGDIEFNARWNTSSRLGESRTDDFIAEGSLLMLPVRRLELSASGGYLRRGDIFSSARQQISARFLGDTSLPTLDYSAELISTADSLRERVRSRWLKQRAGVSYQLGPFSPGFRVEHEDREDRSASILTDTLFPGSFQYVELGPELRISFPFLDATARARYRIDDSVRYDRSAGASRLLRDGTSQTYTLRGELRSVRDLSSTLDVTWRRKRYDSVEGVIDSRRLDNETLLARSQTRWVGLDRGLDLDALYEVQTEQAARVQRVFVRVPYGQGQYIWTDLDSNGVQGEEEFRFAFPGEGEYVRFDVPTEELFPVIDLRTSLRIRLQPRRFIDETTPLGRWVTPLSTETFLRLEEKSQSERESDIYLLRLSAFQNEATTIVGNSVVQQDLHLFEGNPEYAFRLRYLERSGVTRLVQTVERRNDVERSLRGRWQPTNDVGLQLDLASERGVLRSTDTTSIRTYDLTTMSATSDFSYRLEQSLELGWKLRIATTEDVLRVVPRTAGITTNELRAVYSLETRGRFRAELERTTVSGENLGESELSLPYQLTSGYAIGATWIGRLSFEYRFGADIQASVTYGGRAQPPGNRVIHTGQAELRAFF